jgi:riboflavin synthase
MFTGIVSELGVVSEIVSENDAANLRVFAPSIALSLDVGDSVAVNGVCLTAVEVDKDSFVVHAVHETITRTSLSQLSDGGHVNLERPMAAGGRFDGHIVQGHVDAVGTILSLDVEGTSSRVRVEIPETIARYVVEKGSVCVDGTSLTVTSVSALDTSPCWFEIVLIPHTIAVTTFGEREPGDVVNVEVDVIAKYVERMMERGT